MVCPYCSTDMEPIELSGKTFCSNCGLTIGAASPYSPAATITPFSDTDKPTTTETVDTAEPTIPMEPQTPIKDTTKGEFGLPVNEPGDLIISNESVPEKEEAVVESTTNFQEPGKLTVSSDSEQPLATEVVEAPSTTDLPATKEDNNEPEEVPAAESADDILTPPISEEVPPFSQQVAVPDESEFEAPAAKTENSSQTNEEKIKEVDTLGASGILLDILSENYHATEAKNEINALNAAEEVLDEVESEDKKEPKHNKSAKAQPEVALNPVENPELSSPLDELEITDGEQGTIDSKTTKVIDTEISADKDSTTEKTDVDDLYKLPHEIKDDTTPKPDSKTEAAIEKIEDKLDDLNDSEPTKSDLASGYYDPDTLAPLSPNLIANAPESKSNLGAVVEAAIPEVVDKDFTEKQQAVKSFFKEKVEGPKKKKKSLSLQNR